MGAEKDAQSCILLRVKRVLTAVILVPLVLLLIFKAQGQFWLIYTVVGAVAELALWEYLTLANTSGAKIPALPLESVSRSCS